MKLKKLFKDLKELRKHRKDYKIKWKVKFAVDDSSYLMALLPTILFQPWVYRTPGTYVIYIQWFHMVLAIGEFVYVGSKDEEEKGDDLRNANCNR